jgi:hypothetical protein
MQLKSERWRADIADPASTGGLQTINKRVPNAALAAEGHA